MFLPSTLIWNRGEPPPQSSSVTLNCVDSDVRSENFRPAGTPKSIQLALFALEPSEKSETNLTLPIPASAAPCNVKSAPRAAGANVIAATAPATATRIFLMELPLSVGLQRRHSRVGTTNTSAKGALTASLRL